MSEINCPDETSCGFGYDAHGLELVTASDLVTGRIGRKVEVLGEFMELRKFGFKEGADGSRVELWLERWVRGTPSRLPVIEALFWDVNADAELKFQLVSVDKKPIMTMSAPEGCWARIRNWACR